MKRRIFRFWWLGVFAFIAVFSLAVMLLWNWLLPTVVGLPEITFLQALGLLVLARILFGGIGGTGKMFAHGAARDGDRGHVRENWFKMSDDERREFLRSHNPLYSHVFGDSHKDQPPRGPSPGEGFHPESSPDEGKE
jgi:hypothetical protein